MFVELQGVNKRSLPAFVSNRRPAAARIGSFIPGEDVDRVREFRKVY